MNDQIDALPQAIAAASTRLPRRLELFSESEPVVLMGMSRGQELQDFTPPLALRLIVLAGRVSISSAVSNSKLGRLDEFELKPGLSWGLRALESCDVLLLEGSLTPAASRNRIANFVRAD